MIGKRLRFEILKRDGFACGYCGRRAPEVELEVDHRTPVALGGTDDPSNLLAACRECNGGKAAVPLDVSRLEDMAAPVARPRADASYHFPADDGSAGPPIVVDFDDPLIRKFWNERRPRSRWEAGLDLVRRTEAGEPRGVRALARDWQWSTSKVQRFLRDVEAEGVLEVAR